MNIPSEPLLTLMEAARVLSQKLNRPISRKALRVALAQGAPYRRDPLSPGHRKILVSEFLEWWSEQIEPQRVDLKSSARKAIK